MPRFRVHTTEQQHTVTADTPTQAAAIVRKSNPGVVIRKVKRDKSDNVSPRQAMKQIPFYQPGLAEKITETGQKIVREIAEKMCYDWSGARDTIAETVRCVPPQPQFEQERLPLRDFHNEGN